LITNEEMLLENPRVGGSNPPPGTITFNSGQLLSYSAGRTRV